jgi:hypothetical protein
MTEVEVEVGQPKIYIKSAFSSIISLTRHRLIPSPIYQPRYHESSHLRCHRCVKLKDDSFAIG